MAKASTLAAAPAVAYAMALLARGVPLSLLFDLVLGPRSREVLDAERLTAPVPLIPMQRPSRTAPELPQAG